MNQKEYCLTHPIHAQSESWRTLMLSDTQVSLSDCWEIFTCILTSSSHPAHLVFSHLDFTHLTGFPSPSDLTTRVAVMGKLWGKNKNIATSF